MNALNIYHMFVDDHAVVLKEFCSLFFISPFAREMGETTIDQQFYNPSNTIYYTYVVVTQKPLLLVYFPLSGI